LTSFARVRFRERRCPDESLFDGVGALWSERSIPVRERFVLLACAALVFAYHERVVTVGSLLSSARQLRSLVPEDDRDDTDVLVGEALLQIGYFDQAEAHLLAGLEAASVQGRERQLRRCHALLAQVYFEQVRFGEAAEAVHRLLEAVIAAGITDSESVGRLVALGWQQSLADVFMAADEMLACTEMEPSGADVLAVLLGSVAFERTGRAREMSQRCGDVGVARAFQAVLALKERPNETGIGLSVPVEYRRENGPDLAASFFEWTLQALAHWCRRRQPRGYAIARDLLNQPLRFAESRLATWIYDLVRNPYDSYTAEMLDARIAALSATEPGFARFVSVVIPRPESVSLTPVELEIIREFSKGGSAKEVARRLERNPNTVNRHFQSAARKLRVSGRRQVIKKATSAGLI
jgi:DNA-binding CsgD family transcriptional regulator